MRRPLLALLAPVLAVALLALATPSFAANPGAGSVDRDTAIKQLRTTTLTIDRSLALMKAGDRAQAFEISKAGYLNHFEFVEIPLRAANPALTLDAEEKFAEIRALIRTDAPTSEVRARSSSCGA